MGEFIVSARKYRPASFASVVGQDHITSTLKNAIERGQLAHAYLFCGPRGVGKTTCARIFAKAINCLSPNGAEACNECESCRSFNESRSLNIHELDAASNNTVDDIRSLIEQVRIIPQLGKYALFIIDEVHMLSASAFNAFLKTLEEPPAHAIFILATTEKHKILPTILSRCQIFDFNRIKVEDGVKYLRYIAQKEQITIDEESLNLIAQKADGGMRDALSMFDKAVSFCGTELNYKGVAQTLNILDYDTYFDITQALISGNYVESLLIFDRVLSQGFSAQTFITGLNAHLRDLLVAKDQASLSLMEYTAALTSRYQTQSQQCSIPFIFGAISLLTDADGRLRQSSNQRLLVELGLMKIAGLGQKKNVGEGNFAQVIAPLPDLNQSAASTNVQQQQSAQVQNVEVSNSTPKQPIVQEQKNEVVEPKVEKVEPVVVKPTVVAETTQPKPKQSDVTSPRKPLFSLQDLINNDVATSEEVEGENNIDVEVNIDPSSEEKLESVRGKMMSFISKWRPRFVTALESMTFVGNNINISVPTSELRDEILRNKTELLLKIVDDAQISGVVVLNVEVNEKVQAMRPIKLEDRIEHMLKLNPLLSTLKETFDLDFD